MKVFVAARERAFAASLLLTRGLSQVGGTLTCEGDQESLHQNQEQERKKVAETDQTMN